jgi:hypothetical protein
MEGERLSKTQTEKAVSIAMQIAAKAEAALESMAVEMDYMKWPPEFRAIMWDAVSHTAATRAKECRALKEDK